MPQDPPQDAAAEQAVLGAMITWPQHTIDVVSQVLDGGDYYRPAHETVHHAIMALWGRNEPVDMVSVAAELVRTEVIVSTGGHPYIHTLASAATSPDAAEHHAQIVAEKAVKRRVVDAGVRITQMGYSAAPTAEETREFAQQAVEKATRTRQAVAEPSMGELLDDVVNAAENGDTGLLSTPWQDVNRILGGLAPGRLVVVGARPGIGKSVMGTNLALHFAEEHRRAVLVASMEMPRREVGQRLLAARARVSLSGLQDGTLDDDSWGRVRDLYGVMTDLPLAIDDASEQTVFTIQQAARSAARKHGLLALIVVDYLQLMQPAQRSGNRAEDVGTISRGLKVLARDTGACVVAMVQVNREGTRHADGRPRMSDIRESGSIESDADQVVLLHQPSETTPELEVIVAKNRHRQRGLTRLHIQGHYSRLLSVQPTPTTSTPPRRDWLPD